MKKMINFFNISKTYGEKHSTYKFIFLSVSWGNWCSNVFNVNVALSLIRIQIDDCFINLKKINLYKKKSFASPHWRGYVGKKERKQNGFRGFEECDKVINIFCDGCIFMVFNNLDGFLDFLLGQRVQGMEVCK